MTPSALSTTSRARRRRVLGLAACLLGFGAGGPGHAQPAPVRLAAVHPNAVSFWNEVANRTVNAAPAGAATPEERQPAYHVDLATVHVAIHDAVSAVDGRYRPFAVTPKAPAAGASLDAAASAAAYGVLQALFPSRGAQYQAAYDGRIAALPAGEARTQGVALGREVAAAVVALRAADGRDVVLPPYVSGTAPGRFRSANAMPFNRHVPFIRPFSLTRIDQFRPPPPPPLDSAAYAAAFELTRAAGGAASTTRTPEEWEIARFHSEPPHLFVTRNLGRFASSTGDVADAARLMAFLYVAHADAIGACFEAKYFYEAWRPLSAIPLAGGDGNDRTAADAAWTPALPTPNHPEYPAAHSCTSGALGETLRQVYGTREVRYAFDSAATGTTRSYASTDALDDESRLARLNGGMHFDFATAAGVELGVRVARWVGAHHFGRRP